MIHEKSAGIICFRIHPQEGLQFLVLYHRGDYWNFPKGRIEAKESEKKAAARELAEETGVKNIKIIDGWRQQTEFFFKETRSGKGELIKKQFVIFLAKTPHQTAVKISHEHNGYAWVDYKIAKKLLRFKNLKTILDEAHSYIMDKIKQYQKSKNNK